MSIGERVFFVDGKQVTRISLRRFESLWNEAPNATMPERAGQRVRCALVYVEIDNRRPVGIRHIDYMVLSFDSSGRVDTSQRRRQERLAVESVSRNLPSVSEAVVEIGPHLASRSYRDEFKWTPTEEQAGFIGRLALLH